MAAQTPLLNELCSVCNKEVPKYTCPGCGTRTCSLACVKTHKQRAVCDGKRDPTKFVKKSNLETPAGIDHDFNFLSGLERKVNRSEKDLTERGLGNVEPKKSWKGHGYRFNKRLQETGVIVRKAPDGMTRQKLNRTEWKPNTQALHWTTEWLFENGERKMQKCPDFLSVNDCYGNFFKTPERKRKRGRGQSEGSKKNASKEETSVEQDLGSIEKQDDVHIEKSQGNPASTDQTMQDKPVDDSYSESIEQMEDLKNVPANEQEPSDEPTLLVKAPPSHSEVFFYLLKPETPAHEPKVLVPVDPSVKLMDSLRNQVVLEFPTFVVLSKPPAQLSDDYITEDEFYTRVKKEAAGLDGDLDVWRGTKAEEAWENPSSEIDQSRIMEVLKRDFTGRGGA